MLKPELKPQDVFHIIGFTNDDIAKGIQLRAMRIQDENMKLMIALHKQLGPLAVAAQKGLVVLKPLEVYFLDRFVGLDDDSFETQFGKQFQVVDYYNDTALALSKRFSITLPKVIGKITREQLPKHIGISIRAITYDLLATAAASSIQ
jgi:hypothetical protein